MRRRRIRVAELVERLGDVRADVPAGLELEADPDRVEQALRILLDNGRRHGGGDVEIHAKEKNGMVELHVLDRGPGFSTTFLPRAFGRFNRADEARASGGTGLGLSIARAIAQAHGGDAHAANRDGGGADVWLSLPALIAVSHAPPTLEPVESGGSR